MGKGQEKAKKQNEDWKQQQVPVTGLNTMGADAYFIRLKDNKFAFIHPDPSKETETEMTYVVTEGVVGAAIFRKEQAESFIFHTYMEKAANNLEIVQIKEVLGNDNSEN